MLKILKNDHVNIRQLISVLQNKVEALKNGKTLELEVMVDDILQESKEAQTPLDSLSDFLAHFITLQLQHMALEETQAHPLIQANLSAEDWANIKAKLKFDCNKDPLFGDNVAEHYQDLAANLSIVGRSSTTGCRR